MSDADRTKDVVARQTDGVLRVCHTHWAGLETKPERADVKCLGFRVLHQYETRHECRHKKVQDEPRPEDALNHSIFADFKDANHVLKRLLRFQV